LGKIKKMVFVFDTLAFPWTGGGLSVDPESSQPTP
jgi:hypothetical protein